MPSANPMLYIYSHIFNYVVTVSCYLTISVLRDKLHFATYMFHIDYKLICCSHFSSSYYSQFIGKISFEKSAICYITFLSITITPFYS